ncbi:MAG TPA: response regulator transcription factor [Sporichthyaceae bacterium]|nr:response regulator transcription factor [Sporichthyaceae bacterium]
MEIMRKCAVLVVGRDALVLQGVRRVLEGTPDFYVIGQSTNLRDGFSDLAQLPPDVVLVDLRREDCAGGPELCRRLRVLLPPADVVIRAAPEDSTVLAACLRAGAVGVLSSGSSELDLVDALRRVRGRETVLDSDVRRALRQGDREVGDDGHHLYERLRPREHEVLLLMAEGLGTRDIADKLDLSRNTVRSYAQALMSKLQVHSRVQLVVAARRLDLV